MTAREELFDIADRLHSIAIHLLRRLRKVDEASGLSGPRLSALSVVVFGGPLTVTELAEAEQVRVPTMTRLVQALEGEDYVRRRADPLDGRVAQLEATAKGRKILLEGRARRVQMLAKLLEELGASDQKAVRKAVDSLESIIAGRRTPSRPSPGQ
jgi:DNA-binding MarR family transcriptional regulator